MNIFHKKITQVSRNRGNFKCHCFQKIIIFQFQNSITKIKIIIRFKIKEKKSHKFLFCGQMSGNLQNNNFFASFPKSTSSWWNFKKKNNFFLNKILNFISNFLPYLWFSFVVVFVLLFYLFTVYIIFCFFRQCFLSFLSLALMNLCIYLCMYVFLSSFVSYFMFPRFSYITTQQCMMDTRSPPQSSSSQSTKNSNNNNDDDDNTNTR